MTYSESPGISVLLPVYNVSKFIKEALESVLNQSYKDFEIIIIDDASTDNTLEIVKMYKDKRIKLIEKPENTGYTRSLNMGLSLAKGKYIARMDGDDICVPERFELQHKFMEEHPNVILCGSAVQILGTDIKFESPVEFDDIKVSLLKENCITHPSVLMRTAVIKKFSIEYDVTAEPAEDYRLWVRFSTIGQIYNDPRIMLYYRRHDFQVSNKKAAEQHQSALKSRVEMIKNVCREINEDEENLLLKILNNADVLTFQEIQRYFSLQKKIIASNINCFIRPVSLLNYLNSLSYNQVKKYFLYRERFNPTIIYHYLLLKRSKKISLDFLYEGKLVIKCLLFHSTSRKEK